MVQKYVTSHDFSIVPSVNLPRSSMKRNCERKFTFDPGYLVPFYWEEVLPGDTINLTHSLFVRMLSPLSYPIMDNLWLETFYFYVPERILWTHWKEFMGENRNPVSNPTPTVYTMPQITPTNTSKGFDVGSIADYLGVPVGVPNISIRASFHRAYNMIYNEWFKDENLIDDAVQYDGDSNKTDSDYPLQRRGKRFDYFTSCLPWPQKGVAVELPLGNSCPVYGTGYPLLFQGQQNGVLGNVVYTTSSPSHLTVRNALENSTYDGVPLNLARPLLNTDTTNNAELHTNNNVFGYAMGKTFKNVDGSYKVNPAMTGLVADLTDASSITINSLYEAFAYQKFFQQLARSGSRYTEIIRGLFGVISPDARQQRPEFLGSSSDLLQINTVVQNSETTSSSALGELSAFGLCSTVKHGFIKSFSEHGVILGLLNIRADLTYQQGIDRGFSRKNRFDFYFPALANIGEQAVLNKEIYAQGTSADDNVFGYIGRWDEYRFKKSEICGLLRSDFGQFNSSYQTLDAWHLSQKFSNLPTLNKTFIEDTPPIDRVEAITNLPAFICDCHFEQSHARVMPMYNIPGKDVL